MHPNCYGNSNITVIAETSAGVGVGVGFRVPTNGTVFINKVITSLPRLKKKFFCAPDGILDLILSLAESARIGCNWMDRFYKHGTVHTNCTALHCSAM
jgi:hypothetical protein